MNYYFIVRFLNASLLPAWNWVQISEGHIYKINAFTNTMQMSTKLYHYLETKNGEMNEGHTLFASWRHIPLSPHRTRRCGPPHRGTHSHFACRSAWFTWKSAKTSSFVIQVEMVSIGCTHVASFLILNKSFLLQSTALHQNVVKICCKTESKRLQCRCKCWHRFSTEHPHFAISQNTMTTTSNA